MSRADNQRTEKQSRKDNLFRSFPNLREKEIANVEKHWQNYRERKHTNDRMGNAPMMLKKTPPVAKDQNDNVAVRRVSCQNTKKSRARRQLLQPRFCRSNANERVGKVVHVCG